MAAIIDLSGKTFGRLEVLSRAPSIWGHCTAWRCRCSCGNEIVTGSILLRRGKSKSCGCLRAEITAKNKLKHGDSRRGEKSRLYRIWVGIRYRCSSQDKQYYGAKGIKVCADWQEFVDFKVWAESSGYADHLTIDRINSDGNYEPDNCRWASIKRQARNRSTNRYLDFRGERLTVADWCERLGFAYHAVNSRLHRGWSAEKALTTPFRKSPVPSVKTTTTTETAP